MMYPNFAKQMVLINTKNKDEDVLKLKVQPIIDFANKHGISFDLCVNAKEEIIAIYEAQGKTSAYCKGMVAEVKQMLKEIFKCKLDVLLTAG